METNKSDDDCKKKILVTDVPDGATRDTLIIHFQRCKNGGGDIRSLVFPKSRQEPNVAVVQFDDPANVQSVLEKEHTIVKGMKRWPVRVNEMPPEVFDQVTLFAGKSSVGILEDSPQDVKTLLEETGVKMDQNNNETKFTGEWFQIKALAEKMDELYYSEKKDPKIETGAEQVSAPKDNAAKASAEEAEVNTLRGESLCKKVYGREENHGKNTKEEESTSTRDELHKEQSDRESIKTKKKEERRSSPESQSSAGRIVSDGEGGKENTESKELAASRDNSDEKYKEAEEGDKEDSVTNEKANGRNGLESDDDHFEDAVEDSVLTDDNVITVDSDIYLLMKRSFSEVDNIINHYKVKERTQGENCVLEFGATGSNGDCKNGIDAFQKLYLETIENTTQKTYELPEHVDDEHLSRAMQMIETKYPKVVFTVQKGTRVIFLSLTEREAQSALYDFAERLGDRTRTSSYARRQPKDEVLFKYTFPRTGLHVSVVRGDISGQQADAIVNAANNELRNGAGVTGAIFRAGGQMFADYCEDFMYNRHNRELEVGEVVHTEGCGDLICKNVIHVVGPIWHRLGPFRRESHCNGIMEKLCSDLIKYANNALRAQSLATPAISTGIYGVPLKIFCKSMMKAIDEFNKDVVQSKRRQHLTEIRLVNFNYSEAADIARYFRTWKSSLDPGSTPV